MDTQSGLQLPAWLSGLNLGQLGGMSGAPGIGGGGPASQAMGMEGGLGLSDLSALLAAQGDVGGGIMPGQQSDLFAPIMGSVGQGIGSFAPQQQYLAAGAMGQPQQGTRGYQSGYQAGQTTEGSIDPLQIIQLALKAGSPFAQMMGQPQQQGATGAQPEQQSGYGSYRQGEQQDYTGGNETPFSQYGSLLGLDMPALAASLGISPQEYESLLGAGGPMQIELAQQSGINPEAIMSILKAQSMGMPEQMGWLPNAEEMQALRTGQEAPAPGTGGYGSGSGGGGPAGGGLPSDPFGGGLLGLTGLTHLAGGIRGGGTGGAAEALGGSAQTLSGLNKLFPDEAASLSDALGMGGQGFGGIAGGLGGASSLFNLANAAQAGSPGGIALGAANTYSALAPFMNLPSFTQMAGGALSGLTPAAASGLAEEAAALGIGGAAETGASAAGSAGLGLAGGAASIVFAPFIKSLTDWLMDTGHPSNPFQETNQIRSAFNTAWPQMQGADTAARQLTGLQRLSPEDQVAALRSAMEYADIARAGGPAVSQYISTQGGRKGGWKPEMLGQLFGAGGPNIPALDVSGYEAQSPRLQLEGSLGGLAARDALIARGIDPYAGRDPSSYSDWDINQTLGLLSPYAGVYKQGYYNDPNNLDAGYTDWQQNTLGQFTPEELGAIRGGGARLPAIEAAFSRVNPNFSQSEMGRLLSQWGDLTAQPPQGIQQTPEAIMQQIPQPVPQPPQALIPQSMQQYMQQTQPSPFQTMGAGGAAAPGYGGYDEQTISLMRSLGLL